MTRFFGKLCHARGGTMLNLETAGTGKTKSEKSFEGHSQPLNSSWFMG
jgi:hypothetical protein